MNDRGQYNPFVHRTAVATTCVALLPIVIGALVTSMGAGMAFRDWPNSDGQFMLTYPWLADFVRGAKDKFVEHGHRLAGMAVGLCSILLAAVILWKEKRRWVKGLGLLVLLGVIGQGVLGGLRVLGNRSDLAMIHGNFGAVVFCLMAVTALVTSRRWNDEYDSPATVSPVLKGLAVVTPLVIYGQYILGGRQRHMHDMLHEHLAFAFVATVFIVAFVVAAYRSGIPWLRRLSIAFVFLLLVQLGLGAGAWVTKFGFAPTGFVATQGSVLQLAIRSSHTVVGMLLLMSSVILAARVFREAFREQTTSERTMPVTTGVGSLSTQGGAG